MPDPIELTLSQEIFVPEGVMYELWTLREHIECWYPFAVDDLLNAAPQSSTGTEDHLSWTTVDIHSGAAPITLSVTLTELGGKTRIDLLAEGFTDEASRDQHAQQWRLALSKLEDYLTVI